MRDEGLDTMPGEGPEVAPELKALGGPEAEFARLLEDYTLEMRAQFDLFRRLRESAEGLLDGADEALAKAARADIKAATDAIALIIRTLEKIDQLSRQLARDRADAEERQLADSDPDRLRRSVVALIEAQVEARLEERVEAALAARLEGLPVGQSGQGP
ncbi:hypothetical protein FE840_010080 [Peteryoungia desertarenae]|uniref:Uncharacterized protein n=1 Tax=Peteryoungia desertarenae TaxID=1813451 RepID=A0ABX6QMU5_9HYPH|nr:hypothetical protein [Peteryoungia desertarenae]QLF69858.1 hypothetical protein FE840_010080 [Peteryoungia desertarenae]